MTIIQRSNMRLAAWCLAAALAAPAAPALAGIAPACREPGDLAPGFLTGSGPSLAWQVEGDGRISAADAVAVAIIAMTGAQVAAPGGCPPIDDPAPGLEDRAAATFTPIGDGSWTDCDAAALARLLLGEAVLDPDDSAFPGSAPASASALRGLVDSPPLTDSEFLGDLAPLLESIDAAPRGEAAFHAWLELEVLGDCFEIPEDPVAGADSQPSDATLLQRIQATMAWQVLKELVSTVVFAFVPEPIALTVQAADPAMFVALSHAAVRKNIVEARNAAAITLEQEIELLTIVPQNPYEAQRRLLQMQGLPIPSWLKAVPPQCMGSCAPETCANGFDDDGDGLVDCEDPQCAGQPDCVESLCGNHADDDGDGLVDCLDQDCAGKPACVETLCANGADDDGDGTTDCDDSDCEATSACFESACSNGADDDGDGATDCDDSDCAPTGACSETDCGNGSDDDGDGFTDCDDADCQLAGACQPQYCGCWFDTTPPNVNDWWWRCHQQSSETFAAPYDQLVSPGECQCGVDISTICE